MNTISAKTAPFIRERTPLWHTRQAIERGKITIGFLGGSLTETIIEPWAERRWSDKVVNWFVGNFPSLVVNVENAAKGATGSQSALFRVKEDIIDKKCDLVFIEYAVNDSGCPPLERALCREGLLRKLLGSPDAEYDLCVVYAFSSAMTDQLIAGEIPSTIKDFELLCQHYQISSVDMGRYAFSKLQSGELRWSEWLPDGLHPGDLGSSVYATPVISFLMSQYESALRCSMELPAPLKKENWEHATKLPLDRVQRIGPWRMYRNRRIPTVDQVLSTSSLGAELHFSFSGTGLILFRMYSGYAADYQIRVDEGDWIVKSYTRDPWMEKAFDFVREELVFCDLTPGTHSVSLKVIRDLKNVGLGTDFELCDIGVVP